MENVLQLCKVCDLALSHRKQIRWDRYSRLCALVSLNLGAEDAG